ncbi:MAG TPA: HAD hydrolase-like protein [Candidatus Fimivivens sp.]|nr:HAD hydrolase-like protein [Candidatus Fimivivens sp.]
MKEIIFDFDGVIHDTFCFHLEHLRTFFGVTLTARELRDMSNGNIFESLPEQLKDADWGAYADHIGMSFSLLPLRAEIRDTIEALAADYSLHIITSASGKVVEDFLVGNGVRKRFGDVLGWEHDRSKSVKFDSIFEKYDADPSGCVFVTDTLGDILEAREVGVRTIAIDTGFHDRETLLKGKPHAIISNLEELHRVIESLDE